MKQTAKYANHAKTWSTINSLVYFAYSAVDIQWALMCLLNGAIAKAE